MTDQDPRTGNGGDAFDPFAQATAVPEDPSVYYDADGRFEPTATLLNADPPEVPLWGKIVTGIFFGVPLAILWLAAVIRLAALVL